MSKQKASHPFERFEKEPVWRVLEQGIEALAKNGDIEEKTTREYVVGYLAKRLTEAGFEQAPSLRTGRGTSEVVGHPQGPKAGASITLAEKRGATGKPRISAQGVTVE